MDKLTNEERQAIEPLLKLIQPNYEAERLVEELQEQIRQVKQEFDFTGDIYWQDELEKLNDQLSEALKQI